MDIEALERDARENQKSTQIKDGLPPVTDLPPVTGESSRAVAKKIA